MKSHLFLTGERQVGKSTIVDKVLARLQQPVGGFRTFGANYTADGGSDVCIRGVGEDLSHCVAQRRANMGGCVVFPDVFDHIGVRLLQLTPEVRMVVMDELGFMEAEAHAFQRAVLNCLDGPIPVLGVIKPMPHPFLDQIRAHPKVQIVTVRADNRDAIAAAITLEKNGFQLLEP